MLFANTEAMQSSFSTAPTLPSPLPPPTLAFLSSSSNARSGATMTWSNKLCSWTLSRTLTLQRRGDAQSSSEALSSLDNGSWRCRGKGGGGGYVYRHCQSLQPCIVVRIVYKKGCLVTVGFHSHNNSRTCGVCTLPQLVPPCVV